VTKKCIPKKLKWKKRQMEHGQISALEKFIFNFNFLGGILLLMYITFFKSAYSSWIL
jgi:hypothetical protein